MYPLFFCVQLAIHPLYLLILSTSRMLYLCGLSLHHSLMLSLAASQAVFTLLHFSSSSHSSSSSDSINIQPWVSHRTDVSVASPFFSLPPLLSLLWPGSLPDFTRSLFLVWLLNLRDPAELWEPGGKVCCCCDAKAQPKVSLTHDNPSSKTKTAGGMPIMPNQSSE